MTLATFVTALRSRALSLSGSRASEPTTQLMSRLIYRATGSSPSAQEQDAVALILDALRVPERAADLPDLILDRLSDQAVLDLDDLVDQVQRGVINPGQVSDALRRARLRAVPPHQEGA